MARKRLLKLLHRVWIKKSRRWRRSALRRLRNPADADDALQEAVARTIDANPNIENTWETDAYVMKAIRDVTIDKYRLRAARSRGISAVRSAQGDATTPSALSTMLELEEQAQRLFAIKLVREQVPHLPPKIRQAIRLYFLTKPRQTLVQIARAQGVSKSEAHRRVHKGVELLAAALRPPPDTAS